jgi:hypothetical protein
LVVGHSIILDRDNDYNIQSFRLSMLSYANMVNDKLRKNVEFHMKKVPEVKMYCDRCLGTKRWGGDVTLMVVDAAFNSIGLNYFFSIVPKVEIFRQTFVEKGIILSLKDLAVANQNDLSLIWKNKRSWDIARSIAKFLSPTEDRNALTDKDNLIIWSKNSELINWELDPIGSISGVGINTYQYLRMMGGIDTVMPDKIVKRILNKILSDSEMEIPSDDIKFVQIIEKIAPQCGYRPIELCWMTWLIQSENDLIRMEKYSEILSKI